MSVYKNLSKEVTDDHRKYANLCQAVNACQDRAVLIQGYCDRLDPTWLEDTIGLDQALIEVKIAADTLERCLCWLEATRAREKP